MRFLTMAVLAATLAMPAAAQAADITTTEVDLRSVRAKIKAKDFKAALAELQPMLSKEAPNADIYNLMGFCLRKTGEREKAFGWYERALSLNPGHLGALEYQGQLFVETGQMEKARANAAHLKVLCPRGCEELRDLEAAIAAAGKKG
jgi:Flp pilus assembly protein TadD